MKHRGTYLKITAADKYSYRLLVCPKQTNGRTCALARSCQTRNWLKNI